VPIVVIAAQQEWSMDLECQHVRQEIPGSENRMQHLSRFRRMWWKPWACTCLAFLALIEPIRSKTPTVCDTDGSCSVSVNFVPLSFGPLGQTCLWQRFQVWWTCSHSHQQYCLFIDFLLQIPFDDEAVWKFDPSKVFASNLPEDCPLLASVSVASSKILANNVFMLDPPTVPCLIPGGVACNCDMLIGNYGQEIYNFWGTLKDVGRQGPVSQTICSKGGAKTYLYVALKCPRQLVGIMCQHLVIT
jgi:hypothetical protein